jgi:hypothetical protein
MVAALLPSTGIVRIGVLELFTKSLSDNGTRCNDFEQAILYAIVESSLQFLGNHALCSVRVWDCIIIIFNFNSLLVKCIHLSSYIS